MEEQGKGNQKLFWQAQQQPAERNMMLSYDYLLTQQNHRTGLAILNYPRAGTPPIPLLFPRERGVRGDEFDETKTSA